MHYANCSSYNADFDGDEMNVHLLQVIARPRTCACVCPAFTSPSPGRSCTLRGQRHHDHQQPIHCSHFIEAPPRPYPGSRLRRRTLQLFAAIPFFDALSNSVAAGAHVHARHLSDKAAVHAAPLQCCRNPHHPIAPPHCSAAPRHHETSGTLDGQASYQLNPAQSAAVIRFLGFLSSSWPMIIL